MFVEAPQSPAEFEQVATALSDRGVSLVANMVEGGKSPLLSVGELADMGFALVINPLTALLSAVPAIRASLAELRAEGTVRNRMDPLAGFDDFTSIVGLKP